MSFLEQLVIHRSVTADSNDSDSGALHFVESFLKSTRLSGASPSHICGIKIHDNELATDVVGRLPYVPLIVNCRKLWNLIACGKANQTRILGVTDKCLRQKPRNEYKPGHVIREGCEP